MAILLKGRGRVLIITAMVAGGLLTLPLIPQGFWDRQNTTFSYEGDVSAMSRIDNWKFCWKLAVDRPLTGAGFEFMTRNTFEKYAPEFLYTYQGRTWDTHSIYFAMLASHGFPGLLIFISMILSCFISCALMRLAVRRRADLGWVTNYCYLVEISLLALLVNVAFVNMEYFDLVYHLVAVVASLRAICRRELLESRTADASHTVGLTPVPV